MPTRKRLPGKKGENEEALVKAAKARASSRSVSAQSTSPTVVFLLVFTMVAVTSGIYCYHFVDVPDLLEKLQTQVKILSGKTDISAQETEEKQTNQKEENRVEKGEQKGEVKAGEDVDKRETHRSTDDAANSSDKKEDGPTLKKEQTAKKTETLSSTKKETKQADSTQQKSSKTTKDNSVQVELAKADILVQVKQGAKAVSIYDELLIKHPQNPQILHAKAKALSALAEQQRSNKFLEESIETYLLLLDLRDVPKSLMLTAVNECVDRMQFRGWSGKATKALKKVLELYPEETKMWNDLGVQYMMSSKVESARKVFQYVLDREPGNGFAKVHIGFIIKTTDNDHKASIPYLQEGIASGETGVLDGRFVFHLGDALYRTGEHDQAYKVYQDGSQQGIFRSMWQRSLYNVDSLSAHPWWTVKQTGHETELKNLERRWQEIRDEGLAQLDPKTGSFLPEEENLRETGDWKQFTLFQQGQKNVENCKKVPKTCAMIDAIPDAATCKRGQVKFSVMQPGVHVWPHCGPTNCRIRAHLGLVIPDGPLIRVENDTRTWKEGEFIVFDDSFEHEVWHKGTETRLVLIVDLWHPELSQKQKAQLTRI